VVKSIEMNRITGTAKSFDMSVVNDGYIRIYGGMVALGRRCANKRRDELSVSIAYVKAAIAEYEAAQAGKGETE
jgi:hypothetical protein